MKTPWTPWSQPCQRLARTCAKLTLGLLLTYWNLVLLRQLFVPESSLLGLELSHNQYHNSEPGGNLPSAEEGAKLRTEHLTKEVMAAIKQRAHEEYR